MEGVVQTARLVPADWVVILPVVLGLLGAAALLMLRSARDLQWGLALLTVAAIAVCDLLLVGLSHR